MEIGISGKDNYTIPHYFLYCMHAQVYYSFVINRLPIEKRAMAVSALVEGNSIRATCRLTGVCKDAVLKLIRDMGAACAAFHDSTVRQVKVRRVQMR
jgi:hypothetical protein